MKKNLETIDQKPVVMTTEKWLRAAIYIGAFLVMSTNAFNYWITSVGENTASIQYEKEANKRRLNHALQKLAYQTTIKDLKKELNDCKNK